VGCENRLSVALHAPRPASVGGRLPADEEVATGGRLRGDGPRFARTLAPFEGQSFRADGSHTRLSHVEVHSRERLSGRLRRGKAQEGLEGARGGGHFRTPLLALLVTPANEQERAWVGELAEAVQEASGESVELAYVDQGYTGERPAEEAEAHGMRLEVVKHPAAKRGFVLLPRRWVVERDFAWASRFRRLVKDYERLPTTLAGLHFVAFACLFLQQATTVLGASP
jgi:transposase